MKAVILAGGKGSRLKPLTDKLPKPLLPIGKKPILEIIIERLREHNFTDIILNVKYMAESIKAHFGNGCRLGVNITYFEEDYPCGTAGPVRLVEHLIMDEPFLTMNGDLLTNLDFGRMYQAHLDNFIELTMATYSYTQDIPYDVLSLHNGKIFSIEERPSLEFLINAGIYVLSPSVLDLIPMGEFFDMPDLIQKLIDQRRKVQTFPIKGNWLDIGTMERYNFANSKEMISEFLGANDTIIGLSNSI